MFRWYHESTKCYVYLLDVSRPAVDSDDLAWEAAFRTSKWFTRGWTLQELIAPTSVEFFSEEGELLGDKSTLEGHICEIARLPAKALRGSPLSDFSITSRMSWAERRETTREEDQAYSLLGIFDVYMPLIYGEGKEHALERLREIINKHSKVTKLAEVYQWLAPVGCEEKFSKALSLYQRGTCQWFVDGPLDLLLHSDSGESPVLWLKGNSGTGKTVLLSHVIEFLQTSFRGQIELAYFFCSFDDLSSQNPVHIFGSLLAQLSASHPEIIEYFVSKLRDSRPRNKVLQIEEIEEAFFRYLPELGTAFIIIDALNESQHRNEIVESIFRLASRLPNLKFIISSTGDSGRELLYDVHITEVQMTLDRIDSDVRLYLDDNAMPSSFSAGLQNEIKVGILNQSRGMFRYARWQMEHILAQRTGRGAKIALSTMPQDLNGTYNTVLDHLKLGSQDRDLMRRALLWLTVAVRPLRLHELSEAIVLEDSDCDMDSDARLHSPGILIELANGLLAYDPRSNLVTLSHYSIKTFLTSDWIKTSSTSDFAVDETCAHKAVMQRCLTYLLFSQFRGAAVKSVQKYEEKNQDYPLLMYAAHNWPLHLREPDKDDWLRIRQFLSTRSLPYGGNYGWWLRMLGGHWATAYLCSDPLYYAASYGYTALVEAILRFNDDVNLEAAGGRAGSTALQVACFRRQLGAATLLVRAGANPLTLDGSLVEGDFQGFPALWWVVQNDWTELTELTRDMWLPSAANIPQVLDQLRNSGVGPSAEDALVIQHNALHEMRES